MFALKTLAVTALVVLSASAAFSDQPGDRGPTPGLGWGPGGSKGHIVGAPGPVAGVGLPVLAVVGGIAWIRRRRRKSSQS